MIPLSTDTRLKIILPNTNKALAQAIQNATPEQLSTLSEKKDLKSLLTSLFQEKLSTSKSDQTLLTILKNNTVFKTMGNVSDSLRTLLAELKSSPELTTKRAVLETFLKPTEALTPITLKKQIYNSGVFMESKIASAIQTIPNLKQTLENLSQLLSKSSSEESKLVLSHVKALLENSPLSQPIIDSNKIQTILPAVKMISENLRLLVDKNDVLYSKGIASLAQKLDSFSGSISLTQEIKTTLNDLYTTLLSSKENEANAVLDEIEHVLKTFNSSSEPTKELNNLLTLLSNVIDSEDAENTKTLQTFAQTLGDLNSPEQLDSEALLDSALGEDLKSALMTLSEELNQSSDPKASELLEHVDKLLTQIDYHQLLSHLSASNSIYFPFEWDMLEEGSLSLKKNKDKKFYCEINLRLKEYGELDLMMGLYDENQLEIQAHAEKVELKNLLHENLSELRSALGNAGITPRAIRIFEKKEVVAVSNDSYSQKSLDSDFGFEVKV